TPQRDTQDVSVGAPEGVMQPEPNLAAQLFAGRVSVKYPAINQPRLFTRAVGPHAAFISVILGVDKPDEDRGAIGQHLPHFAAGVRMFPFDLLAFVLLPGFAKGGIAEWLELIGVVLGLVEAQNDASPGREWAVGG